MKLPKNKKFVQYRWMYKKKQVDTYKTCLVVKRYIQKKDMDYIDFFSSIDKLATILVLFAIVAILDFDLYQMDVITIFLHGLFNVEIYIAQLKRFVFKDT